MCEHRLRPAVPRERPEAAAPQTLHFSGGFCPADAAVIEGEVCGNWLGGAMRSDRIELANKPERVSVAKRPSRADATEARREHATTRLLCVPIQPKPAGRPARNSSARLST